eukprot:TRINITY_DN14276_c0_g8_i1.p2 TRINITY_DN14276_c0_g8~~TRINITY_DN14276_c0_g8_i1.p2  ORF type:complete len:129 (+),score=3.57 TRINITY_DN14276_c0_g8_i1:144-530(+)
MTTNCRGQPKFFIYINFIYNFSSPTIQQDPDTNLIYFVYQISTENLRVKLQKKKLRTKKGLENSYLLNQMYKLHNTFRKTRSTNKKTKYTKNTKKKFKTLEYYFFKPRRDTCKDTNLKKNQKISKGIC